MEAFKSQVSTEHSNALPECQIPARVRKCDPVRGEVPTPDTSDVVPPESATPRPDDNGRRKIPGLWRFFLLVVSLAMAALGPTVGMRGSVGTWWVVFWGMVAALVVLYHSFRDPKWFVEFWKALRR